MAALGAPPDDSQGVGEANSRGPYLTSQQRGEAPAPTLPKGCANFGGVLCCSSVKRPPRAFSLLAPRTRPEFAAALLYESQTWCTRR